MSGIRNKTVIITGASSGIGAATARRLAHWGAKLMLAARREDRLADLVAEIAEIPGTAKAYRCDVTDRRHVRELVEATISEYGRVDVLINNAGTMPLAMLGDDNAVEPWEQCIDVNVKGVVYAINAVVPHMYEHGQGHVINIASVAGHKVFPGSAVYSATKHAVRAISEGLRQESGERIRSTVISPGAVGTELIDSVVDPEIRKRLSEHTAEAMDADAIAGAIAYAIEQPYDVDVNEVLVRPTGQRG